MKIAIPYKIYEQIQFYVDRSTIECSGLGKVLITPQGYEVTEVCLLKQENTGTHTEIDAQAVTKAMYDLRASQGGIYFWWHSHVNMDVFWSGTDKATIEEIGQNGLCVAVVFNKKKEMKGAVWLKGSDLSPNLYFDDVTVAIEHEGASQDTKDAWSSDFDEKCKAKTYAHVTGGHFPIRSLDQYVDYFDITSFEKELAPEYQVKLAALSNDLIYGFTPEAVDKALAEVLNIVKQSKASKHDKKKAYKEYKEMALEQKNYLKEHEESWNKYGTL